MDNKTTAAERLIAAGLIASALAVLIGPLPIVAIGAILFIGLSARFPMPALAIVVISLPFYPLDRHLGRYSISVNELLFLLTTAGGILRGLVWIFPGWPHPLPKGEGTGRRVDTVQSSSLSLWERVRVRAGLSVPDLLALAFVAIGLLSLRVSVDRQTSLHSLRVIIVEPVVFYFLVTRLASSRRDLYWLTAAIVAAGLAVSLVGLYQYATDQNIITAEDNIRRIRGFYGSPNNLGLFLGRTIPVGLALALGQRHKVWWGALAVASVAELLTFSIGGWVGTAAGVLAVTWLWSRTARRNGLAIGAGFLIVGVIAAALIPRIGSHFDVRSGTTFLRLEVWQSGLHMIRDHPIWGIGLDQFLYYYQHGYMLPAAWREPDLSHPHNALLDAWLSLGLPGFLVFVALLAVFMRQIGQLMNSGYLRILAIGLAGAMIDTVVHGMVDNFYFLIDLAMLFWLMFGIVAGLNRAEER